jgi:dipeptidyl aminopeptidase/acylaminoacyl peptidase
VADRILLARDIPRDNGHASQFSVIGRTGGEESPLDGPPVENVLDFDWSPDGAEIMYLHRDGGGQLRLTARDTTGRTREIKQLTESEAIIFRPLADGGVSIVATDRHSLSVVDRPGKRDMTWLIPNWMSVITHIARSPDGKSLAVAARSITLDTIVVATLDLETGHFARLAAYPGEDSRVIAWLKDGSIMFVFRGPDGAFGLYRVLPGRPAEKIGALPYYRAEFSVSNDGRHVAAFGYNDKNDVYMIRNFGELLRR